MDTVVEYKATANMCNILSKHNCQQDIKKSDVIKKRIKGIEVTFKFIDTE